MQRPVTQRASLGLKVACREGSGRRATFRTRLLRDAWRIAVDAFSRQPRPLWSPRRDVFQTSRPQLSGVLNGVALRRACGDFAMERGAPHTHKPVRRGARGVCEHRTRKSRRSRARSRGTRTTCRPRGAGYRSEADVSPDRRCQARRSRTPAASLTNASPRAFPRSCSLGRADRVQSELAPAGGSEAERSSFSFSCCGRGALSGRVARSTRRACAAHARRSRRPEQATGLESDQSSNRSGLVAHNLSATSTCLSSVVSAA
jgi:hypothetical protein